MNRSASLSNFIFLCILFLANGAYANEPSIRVVTSFSILEDLVAELGGEHVSIVNLVNRNSDAHTYYPKPSDAVAIANADLVIFNGLGFEGWIERLIKNSSYTNKQLIASEGVNAIKNDEEIDPHAWQSFENIRAYIKNITDTLVELRPQYTDEFTQRQRQYLTALNTLEKSLIQKLATVPKNKRIVVTSHDAFGYLEREFEIQFLAPLGLNIEIEASAEDVANVIDQVREKDVKALFVENINNPRLLERIASETNAVIGGRLYSDALSDVDGPAGTYLNMMQHNISSLINAFTQPSD